MKSKFENHSRQWKSMKDTEYELKKKTKNITFA